MLLMKAGIIGRLFEPYMYVHTPVVRRFENKNIYLQLGNNHLLGIGYLSTSVFLLCPVPLHRVARYFIFQPQSSRNNILGAGLRQNILFYTADGFRRRSYFFLLHLSMVLCILVLFK